MNLPWSDYIFSSLSTSPVDFIKHVLLINHWDFSFSLTAWCWGSSQRDRLQLTNFYTPWNHQKTIGGCFWTEELKKCWWSQGIIFRFELRAQIFIKITIVTIEQSLQVKNPTCIIYFDFKPLVFWYFQRG